MSQPPPYSPSHSFVSDSGTLPNFPGQALDVEFNAIDAVIGDIESNIAMIQRDDGALANASVGYDQLSPTLQTSGIAPANAWLTATSYVVGQGVVQAGALYRCLVAHTSGTFATDLAAGDWLFVATLTTAFVAGANLTLTANTFSVSVSPSFVTPNINVAIATSINGVAITTAAGATITMAAGKTLTVSNSLTLAGTDGTTQTFPGSSGNVVTSATSAAGDLTGTYPAPTVAASAITNAKLANMAAWTFKGNGTSGSAAPTDITIDGLTLKASPAATDEIMIWDVAASAWKKAVLSGVSGAGAVSSIAGNTGAFTLGAGLTNSTNVLLADASYHRGYLSGLTLSTAGSSATFSVSPGVSADSTNVSLMKLASSYSKTTASWALGSGNGALDTGAIANSTWYHVFEIQRPDTGVVDVLVSLSATAPTMPTNYTLFRRIGAMKTNGSAQWTKFVQLGDEFLWDAPTLDVSAATGSSAINTKTLNVPLGAQVNVLATVSIVIGASTDGRLYVFSPDVNSAGALSGASAANPTVGAFLTAGNQAWFPVNVRTNTSSQIRIAASNSDLSVSIATLGYIDRRGRDA